jgi:hypothetical protein
VKRALDRLAERILSLTAVDDAPRRISKLRAAWIIVSLHVTVRLTLAIFFAHGPRALLPLPGLLFVLGLRRRLLRPAAIVLALVECVRFALAYPDVSNHYLIECLAIAIFAVVDLDREEEQGLCLQLLAWLVVVALFSSGLQKVLHGAYFKGQYLAYMIANTDRFRDFFGPLLSAADLAHLKALAGATDHLHFAFGHALGPMPGPYRVHSLLFVAISNAVWLGELTVSIGLLSRKIRPAALACGLLLMAGILASSHEVFFDTLFVNLLLLFARSDLNRKLLPLSLAAYALYLLVGFGVVHASFVW